MVIRVMFKFNKRVVIRPTMFIFFNFNVRFVTMARLRSCIWLIGYVTAVTVSCCLHDSGGKIKILIF
jgi:hypothetical protein